MNASTLPVGRVPRVVFQGGRDAISDAAAWLLIDDRRHELDPRYDLRNHSPRSGVTQEVARRSWPWPSVRSW
jgi:hypothetical protein